MAGRYKWSFESGANNTEEFAHLVLNALKNSYGCFEIVQDDEMDEIKEKFKKNMKSIGKRRSQTQKEPGKTD